MAVLGVDLSFDGGTSYSTQEDNTFPVDGVEVFRTYGGSTDTWGRTWTVSELNDTNFRARLISQILEESEVFEMDHIKIKVYYRPKIVLVG